MNRHERRCQAAKEDRKLTMTCDSHGDQPWEGTVCCPSCFRCYQTKDESAPYFCPENCVCGTHMLTAVGSPKAQEDQARAICGVCFTLAAVNGGRAVPEEKN